MQRGRLGGQQCPHGHGRVCICTHFGALTDPSPQCRCGQRHQPVHAPPWGADQERGQEVGEEFLPKKGASPEHPNLALPSPEAPGEPRDLGSQGLILLSYGLRDGEPPPSLSLLPSDDGESAVR